jgi:hypothetical protein
MRKFCLRASFCSIDTVLVGMHTLGVNHTVLSGPYGFTGSSVDAAALATAVVGEITVRAEEPKAEICFSYAAAFCSIAIISAYKLNEIGDVSPTYQTQYCGTWK